MDCYEGTAMPQSRRARSGRTQHESRNNAVLSHPSCRERVARSFSEELGKELAKTVGALLRWVIPALLAAELGRRFFLLP